MTVLDKETNMSVSNGENDVSQFLQEIRAFPRLTHEEENELARRCAEGDEDAIRQMVNSNLRLVVHIAEEYVGRGVALLDLIQEGSIGLLAAARKFDYTRELRFSTYATKWIRQGITRCLMNQGGIIRIPLHTAELMNRMESERKRLRQEHAEEPSPALLAQALGLTEGKILQLQKLAPEVSSLDTPIGEEDEATLQSILEDLRTPQPYEELIRMELERTIAMLMSTLTDRQQQILRLHFGMDGGKRCSLEEIGKILGISKERARQIEHQAMEKLQAAGIDFGLEEFLND